MRPVTFRISFKAYLVHSVISPRVPWKVKALQMVTTIVLLHVGIGLEDVGLDYWLSTQ